MGFTISCTSSPPRDPWYRIKALEEEAKTLGITPEMVAAAEEAVSHIGYDPDESEMRETALETVVAVVKAMK